MTPQEIESIRMEGLTDKVESLSTMVELLKAERDALTDKVEQLEWCLKDRKAFRRQAFDANEALKAERDALAAQVEALTKTVTEAKAIYEEFSLFVWKSFVLEITNSARVCNRREIYEMMDEKFQSVIPDGYIATTPQQCLRDVKAGAIEAAISSCFLYADDVLALDELKRYAEKVRQGAA